jgi:hypothetical protein
MEVLAVGSAVLSGEEMKAFPVGVLPSRLDVAAWKKVKYKKNVSVIVRR